MPHGNQTVRVIDSNSTCPEISIIEGGGNAKVVLWPGNGSEFRSMQLVRLEPAARTVLLRHTSDCVYYVVEGAGAVAGEDGSRQAIAEGSMVHIDAGDGYRIEAGSGGMRFLGGPCPPDPALYAELTAEAGV